jgi:hypothetical protein
VRDAPSDAFFAGAIHPRWKWKGKWDRYRPGTPRDGKRSAEKGAEASIAFEGTGVIVIRPYLPMGDLADVCVGGTRQKTIDTFPEEDSEK